MAAHAEKAAIVVATTAATATIALENARGLAAGVGTGALPAAALNVATGNAVGVAIATGAVTATTWDPSNVGANVTLSNGNLTITVTTAATSSSHATPGYLGNSPFKLYFEVAATTVIGTADTWRIGITPTTGSLTSVLGGTSSAVGFTQQGKVVNNNTVDATYFSYASGAVIGMAVDFIHGKVWFTKDGVTWNNDVIANQNPATNTGGFSSFTVSPFTSSFTIVPGFGTTSGSGNVATGNFGASGFAYALPGGFDPWNAPGLSAFLATFASGDAVGAATSAIVLSANIAAAGSAAGVGAAALAAPIGNSASGAAAGLGSALVSEIVLDAASGTAAGAAAATLATARGTSASGSAQGAASGSLSAAQGLSVRGLAAVIGDAEANATVVGPTPPPSTGGPPLYTIQVPGVSGGLRGTGAGFITTLDMSVFQITQAGRSLLITRKPRKSPSLFGFPPA